MECWDTNYLIQNISVNQNDNFEDIIIPKITLIEFLSYRGFTNQDALTLNDRIRDTYNVVELDDNTSELASRLRRMSSGLKLGDAIVLATSIFHRAEIMTLDKRLARISMKLKYLT